MGRSVWFPPEKVQPYYAQCTMVSRIFLTGERSAPWVIAVVEISRKGVTPWYSLQGFACHEMLNHSSFYRLYVIGVEAMTSSVMRNW
jgi:hypothetical protein